MFSPIFSLSIESIEENPEITGVLSKEKTVKRAPLYCHGLKVGHC